MTDLPSEIAITGHGGICDDLNHSIAGMGAQIRLCERQVEKGEADEAVKTLGKLFSTLRRVEGVSLILQQAASAQVLDEIERKDIYTSWERTEGSKKWWEDKIANDDFTDGERQVIERMVRVRGASS